MENKKTQTKIDGIAVAMAMIIFYSAKVFNINQDPWYYIMAPLAFYTALMAAAGFLELIIEWAEEFVRKLKK